MLVSYLKNPALAFNETQQNFLGLVVEDQINDGRRLFIEGVIVTSIDPDGLAYEIWYKTRRHSLFSR